MCIAATCDDLWIGPRESETIFGDEDCTTITPLLYERDGQTPCPIRSFRNPFRMTSAITAVYFLSRVRQEFPFTLLTRSSIRGLVVVRLRREQQGLASKTSGGEVSVQDP